MSLAPSSDANSTIMRVEWEADAGDTLSEGEHERQRRRTMRAHTAEAAALQDQMQHDRSTLHRGWRMKAILAARRVHFRLRCSAADG